MPVLAPNQTNKKNLREQIRSTFGSRPVDIQRKYLFDAVGYEPSPEQEHFHFLKDEHAETPRFKLAVGGEQAGKSFSAAMELFSFLPWGELFWIVGPDYAQTHNEFNYVWEALEQIDGLDSYPSMPEKGSWTLRTVWGTEIVTKSSDDPAKIAGRAPDGILLVEAAQCPETVFLRCMGRAAPKRGWVCVNGTFENEKYAWYRLKYLEWRGSNIDGGRSCSLPTWSNRKLYPGGRHDPEIKRLERLKGTDWFKERFAGEPVPPRGLVFREFRPEVHMREIERTRLEDFDMYPNTQTVYLPEDTDDELWIDPGYTGGYSVLFVSIVGDTAFIYDEIYKQGWTGEEMANAAARHPRWKRIKKIVMDVAGRQHQAGKSQVEVWYDLTGLRARGTKIDILDGIQRTRISLRPHPETGVPGLILGPACVRTMEEFCEGYRYPIDVKSQVGSSTMDVVVNEKPIDAHNHSAKAIAYGLIDNFGPVRRRRRTSLAKPARRTTGWDYMN